MPNHTPEDRDRIDHLCGTPARTPAPLLSDLTRQLLFPRIFRAGPAAARFDRLIAAAGSILIVYAAGMIGGLYRTRQLDPPQHQFMADPLEPVRHYAEQTGFGVVFIALLLAIAWAGGGAYIARGAAVELGRNLRLKPSKNFAFVRTKGLATLGAVLFIPLAALALLLIPAVLGGLMGGGQGLNVIGAALFGAGLLASLIAAALLIVWVGAFWMMVPAVACDGADVFDAVQRAMGMILNRPVSVGLHILLALVQGVVLVWIVWQVADFGTSLAAWAAGLLSDRGELIAGGGLTGDFSATDRLSIFLVGLWRDLVSLAAMSYAVSYAHTAGVAVYLNARQIVDGQEPNEIWMPGDPPGVTSESDKARPENPDGTSGSSRK